MNKSIVIASGLSERQVGGPATFVSAFKRELPVLAVRYSIVAFTSFLRLPTGIRHAAFLLALLVRSVRADALLALDAASVGVPARIVAKILRKPLVLRIGGDFLWEQAVERGDAEVSLRGFYASGAYRNFRPGVFRKIQRVLRSARSIIVPNTLMKEILAHYYAVDDARIHIIENAIPQMSLAPAEHHHATSRPTLLYAGRFHKLKNLPMLVQNFLAVVPGEWQLRLVGDGPDRARIEERIKALGGERRVIVEQSVPKDAMADILGSASACALPSLTDVSPNFVYECLAAGSPVALSQETGVMVEHPLLIRFNPTDADDMQRVLQEVCSDRSTTTGAQVIPLRPWSTVVSEILEVINDSTAV